MTRINKLGIGFLIAALTAGTAGLAIADGGKRAESRRAEMLEKYDANDDGKLDKAERDIAREERRAERIAPFDKNGDGELNAKEKAAMKAQMLKQREVRLEARFTKLDSNKGGALSIAEFKAGAGKRHGKHGKHGKHGNGQGQGHKNGQKQGK